MTILYIALHFMMRNLVSWLGFSGRISPTLNSPKSDTPYNATPLAGWRNRVWNILPCNNFQKSDTPSLDSHKEGGTFTDMCGICKYLSMPLVICYPLYVMLPVCVLGSPWATRERVRRELSYFAIAAGLNTYFLWSNTRTWLNTLCQNFWVAILQARNLTQPCT